MSASRARIYAALRGLAVIGAISLISACGGGGGGGGGSASASSPGATPNSNNSAAPTLTFTADATSIDSGQQVVLRWNSDNADGCTASGAWSGDRNVEGVETVGPLTQNSTFVLSCSGAGGGVLNELNIAVDQAEQLELAFFAKRPRIYSGEVAELEWVSGNNATCEASGAWGGSQPNKGEFTTLPLTGTSFFTLRCTAGNESTVRTVDVEVVSKRVAWSTPTTKTDGSAAADVEKYVLVWGGSVNNLPNLVEIPQDTTSYDHSTFAAGTYYFAVRVVTTDGLESGLSNVVEKILP
ncbi:MAG: hypothetical protein AAF529_10740 [Pseudomonadota bacterium]